MPTTLDPDIQVQGTLNYCLSAAFTDSDFKDSLGLKYISHMYDTCHYWHFWFRDMPGVFRLELLKSAIVSPEGWEAQFKVKYYPHPDEELFQGLSILEQCCRTGAVFKSMPAVWRGGEELCACHGGGCHQENQFADLADGTGAPQGLLSQEIPPDFFLAGSMELHHNAGEKTALVWESLDRWRVTMAKDFFIPGHEDRPLKVLRKGDVDRNFPGWTLVDFFCRRLATIWQRNLGYTESVSTEQEESGYEFFSDGDGLSLLLAADIRKRRVCLKMR